MAVLTNDFMTQILSMEGGYQQNPSDSGNYACGQLLGTNMGMSAIALKQYTGRCLSKQEIQSLDVDFARGFYNWFMRFWRINEIDDQDVAELILNNFMGLPAKAGLTAQKAINRFGYGLDEDGIMGSKTIAAINHAVVQNKAVVYNAILNEWIAYIQTTKIEFRQGLLNRMSNFPPMDEGATPDAAIISGGASFQLKVISQTIRGAIRGNFKDILSVLLILIVVPGSLIAIIYAINRIRNEA